MIAITVSALGAVGALCFGLVYGISKTQTGLLFGIIGLAAPMIASDFILGAVYRGDILLTGRRINIISFVWCMTGGAIIIISSLLAALTGLPVYLDRGILLAIAALICLRIVIFGVFSIRGAMVAGLAIGLQPALLMCSSFILRPSVWDNPTTDAIVLLLAVLGPMVVIGVMSTMRYGGGKIDTLSIFRAFIYAWAEEQNGPLEEILMRISENRTVEVDTLAFSSQSDGCVGRLVAPYVHPGPFRNVGSSALSLMITRGIEDGCNTLVAHGISNHEWDMARNADMASIVRAMKEAQFSKTSAVCTPIVRAEVKGAKASCQMFGEIALFTLTLSPKSHDDIPDIMKERIREITTAQGIEAIVIDAHNCIDHLDLLDENDVKNLFEAADNAFCIAYNLPQAHFKTGFSLVKPKEWGLKEGQGPCGIGAVVIEDKSAKFAYLVFDSNNMIQGFREKLLEHVKSRGYQDAEALTSDTHLVNAIGVTDRGYSPVGEAMEEGLLFAYVDRALDLAETTPAVVSFNRVKIEAVPVLGANGIELLMGVVKSSFRKFSVTALTAIPLTFLAAALTAFLL